MADQYTDNVKLSKPGKLFTDEDLNPTVSYKVDWSSWRERWGNTLNSNFDLIDSQMTQLGGKQISKEFFGMHLQDVVNNRSIGYGSIRLWDTGTTWRNLEPTKNQFDWNRMDNFVNIAVANNLSILYTLGQPPLWATTPNVPAQSSSYNEYPPNNIQDWRDYITAVATRYKGKIKYYEVWNEPNLPRFYVGSIEKLVELTKEAKSVIKAIDPEAKIISPSYTGNESTSLLDQYLAAGGKDFIDILGVHLYSYPSQPERMISLAKEFKDVAAKNGIGGLPVWNTESTWNNFHYKKVFYPSGSTNESTPVMPTDLAISYIMRLYLCNWIADIERCYFYGMDKVWSSIRLMTPDKTALTPVAYAYQRIAKWLEDASVADYSQTANGLHTVTLLYRDGRQAYILWTSDDSEDGGIPLPPELGISQVIKGDGTVVQDVPTLWVDKIPVYLLSTRNHIPLPSFLDVETERTSRQFVYNPDFQLIYSPNATPYGWVSGSLSVTPYAGTDAPIGSEPITLAPAVQYQGLRQSINNPLIKGAIYQISITYKLPESNPNGEWMLRLETGSSGTLLVPSLPAQASVDPFDETGSGVILRKQSTFTTKTIEFIYDFLHQDSPSGGVVNLSLINKAPSGQGKPIHVASISLEQISRTIIPSTAHNVIYMPTKPTIGSFGKGDQILFTDVETIQNEGYCWICTSQGTFGTLQGVSGTVAQGSHIINITVADGLKVGDRIKIGSDSTIYTVINRRGTTQFELHSNVPTTQNSQPITYAVPAFIKLTVPRYNLPPSTQTVATNPFFYTNTNSYPVDVSVSGGAVTKLEFSRDNIAYYNLGFVTGIVNLSPGDRLKVTYTTTPALLIVPR